MVLPWLPATAMPSFRRISSASISARGITGILRRSASTQLRVAARAPPTSRRPRRRRRRGAASWPIATRMPERAQARERRAVAQVGAGHPVALVGQQLGDAAHADAADADEVHAPDAPVHRLSPPRRRAAPGTRRRCARAASGRASFARGRPMRAQRLGLRGELVERAQHVVRRRASAPAAAAPRRRAASARAFALWWSSAA